MNFIEKYAKKKTVFFASLGISGLLTLYFLISKLSGSGSADSMLDSLDSISLMATLFQIIFYVLLLGSVALAVLAGYYFFNKDKKDYVMLGEFVYGALSTLLSLLSISGVNAIASAARVISSGNWLSVLNIDYDAIMNASGNINNLIYLGLVAFILNIIILLIIKKVININGFEFELDEGDTVSDTSSTNIDINTDKLKETAGKATEKTKELFTKYRNIIIGAIIVVVIAFGIYKIYDSFFNYTTINISEHAKMTFAGKDGDGHISDFDNEIDYDKSNTELSKFVNTVYPSYDAEDLSNGDKVKVTMNYSKETAKANNIKVIGETKTFVVEGLTERYKKASDLPDKLVKLLKKESEESVKESYDSNEYHTYDIIFNSLWYGHDEDGDMDIAVIVYKIDDTTTSGIDGSVSTETIFVAKYITEVDASMLEKDSDDRYYRTNRLYDEDYNLITEEGKVPASLEKSFSSCKLTEVK